MSMARPGEGGDEKDEGMTAELANLKQQVTDSLLPSVLDRVCCRSLR